MRKIETQHDLTLRKQELEERIEQLNSELLKGWNEQISRQVNILSHRLRVCEERLNGEWFRDEYTDNIEQLPFKK
jgi:hypothetical protein